MCVFACACRPDYEDILGSILARVNMLLSMPSFLAATSALLQHEDPKVQRRALTLLNERVTRDKDVSVFIFFDSWVFSAQH